LLDSELEIGHSGSSQALMCACNEVVNLRLILFKVGVNIFLVEASGALGLGED
jgi:hypothetical protein